jgi:hypothetical protein
VGSAAAPQPATQALLGNNLRKANLFQGPQEISPLPSNLYLGYPRHEPIIFALKYNSYNLMVAIDVKHVLDCDRHARVGSGKKTMACSSIQIGEHRIRSLNPTASA